MRLVVSLPDSAEDLTVSGDAWPYETESPSEQAALESHPWITDRPEPGSSDSAGGSSAKTSKKKEE